jgi:ATP-binding cassette subfamily C protein LapB
VISNVVREYETLREFFNSVTISTLGDLPFSFLFVFVICMVAGSIAIVPLVTVPIVIGVCFLVQIPLSGLAKKGLNEGAQRNSVLFETLGGMATIKSVGAEGWAAGRWERAIAEASKTATRTRVISSLSMNVVIVAQLVSTVAIVILGVSAIKDKEMTTGALIAAVILSSRVLAPLAQIASVLTRIYQAKVAYQAISQLIKTPQDRPANARYVTQTSLKGAIQFAELSFVYAGQERASLTNVNLKIEPGEKVGVIGAIGSGKSTLLKLLLSLYSPKDGALLLDGLDVRTLDPTVIRSSIGYMPQTGDLFTGTIRSNIGLHVPFANDDAVFEAAKRSGAIGWIGKLPRGFDTPVGERGAFLSGGQRQSVALTRALLRDPPILALDEPTSEMDGSVEAVFVKQLRETASDKTLILVTHKPSILQLVDRLVVMDGGSVIADGPRDDIIKKLKKVREEQQRENIAS